MVGGDGPLVAGSEFGVVNQHRGDGHRWIRGSDPAPTLSQFQDYVANHQISYYIVANNNGHGPGGWGGQQQHADITAWVAANFKAAKVGSDTVYNLTTPK